jgi:hypothetical protein
MLYNPITKKKSNSELINLILSLFLDSSASVLSIKAISQATLESLFTDHIYTSDIRLLKEVVVLESGMRTVLRVRSTKKQQRRAIVS